MHKAILDIYNLVIETLLPTRCVGCIRISSSIVCNACLLEFTKQENQACIVCQKKSFKGLTHLQCQTSYTPNLTISAFNYQNECFKQAIIAGKYHCIKNVFNVLGKELSLFLAKELGEEFLKKLYISPLPLHISKKRWRGFNQSEILAREITSSLGLCFLPVLDRSRKTKVQKDLKKAERLKNVEESFRINPDCDVRNRNFLLVDDITTTGASFLEASKTLRKAGASEVLCIALAKE